MPCKIQIKQNITNTVESMTDGAFDMSLGNAKYLALDVNRQFDTKIVEFSKDSIGNISRTITVPQGLIDVYYNHELGLETQQARDTQQVDAARASEEYSDDYMFQTKNIFAVVNEIETKLKPINKTINSMGSEKNIDTVLKKAGLESELRKQFIQLVNNNPSLKSLKVSEVLGTHLREFVKDSDRQYYKAIDEPISNKLEDILIDYFDKFKIKREELDNLKEKFGVDSIGVFDVLAKTVYYAKNRNLLTLPEEYGHVFVELLGSISNKKADNPLFKYMFDNIDKWDGYQRVLRDYKDVYVTKEGNMDIYKIKKEAIGQAIGIALVRNYKVQEGDKDFWAKIQGIIDYILDLIKGVDYVSLNTTVDSVAKDILNKNYDKLDRMRKDTSNYNLLTYSETIKNQNKIDGGKALRFMQWFSQKGMLITGSLAYRLQGTTYRPEIDALHDIDNIVPSDVHKVSLNKQDYLTPEQLESSRLYYKYISEGNYREAKKHKLQGNIRLNIDEIVDSVEILEDFKKQFPDTDFLYSFYNEKANAFYITINAIWSQNQELKDRFKSYTGSFNNRLENFTKEELEQIYLFDFFLRPETSDQYKKIEEPEYGLSLAHFNYAFYEKLNMMGRAKDAYDYQMWDYYNDDSILAPDFNDRLTYFQINKSKEESNVMQQKAEMPASRASNETLAKLKQIIAKMGVKIDTLENYLKGNPNVKAKGANALADLVQGIIAIAEGKEGVALTEEMIHIATAMIEQVNPKIVTEMISKITRFKIYKQVLDAYSEDPDYQLPNGKPDIRKIKKEAVDKLIAELIIKQSEGSTEFPELLDETERSMIRNWWNTILDLFRGMYKASNINVFEQTATKIAAGDIGARYYNEVKPGVQELFNDNPELSEIGTAEQYSQYLDSIFPDSKVKDIVYHGSAKNINRFNDSKKGIYFSGIPNYWENNQFVYPAVLDMTNPKEGETSYIYEGYLNENQDSAIKTSKYESTNWQKLFDETKNDTSAIGRKNNSLAKRRLEQVKRTDVFEAVVFKEEQIHLLGNEQDVEGFKSFIETAPAEFKGEGVYFQKLSSAQTEIQKRIQNTKDSIEKREEAKSVKADPLLMDTEEASNYYIFKQPDGTEDRITKRVTDRVKAWYKQRFRDRTFSEAEKTFNEFKRTLGVKYHHFFEEIHGRYFNSDGTRKTKIEPRPRIIDSVDEEVYDKLEQYYVDLIAKFSQKGKTPLVFSEVILYDAKEKEAGTVDLLIVEEDGKANIIDWKFMSVSASANDIPWYKQGAYNVQLGRYKDMLKDAYGVKEVGMNRAIPILMEFKQKNIRQKDSGLKLSGIAIGTIDSNKIQDMRLVPVSEESESTGNEDLDNLLSQLNSIYKQISKSSATSDEEREYKTERLNVLKEAIRAAHASQNITPLINVIKVMRKEGQDIINDWETIYDKKTASSDDFDNSDLSDYSEDIREYLAIANVFVNVDKLIGDLIWNKDMEASAKTSGAKKNLEYRKKVLADINAETKEIFKSVDEVKKIAGKFANKFMGERNLVTGLLKTDAIWKGLGSFFRGASEAPLASVKILYKLVNNAKGRASTDALVEINELLDIRKKLADRGGDLRQLVRQIYRKSDDDKLVNKLIRKYQKAFYDAVDDNATEGKQDKNWLMKNIDVEAYKKEALTKMNSAIDRIAKTHEENPDMMDRLIEQERNKWNISSRDFNGWNNYIIKRHAKDKWLSEEYVELQKDPELFKLYNFINKINTKANNAGYIQNKLYSSFLPFVRKSMAESIAWDFSLSSIMKMGDDLSVRASDVGYGSVNELTGELEHSIPKYYTQDFTQTESGVNDYSDVSEDLFKNMILYINHMEKYKYLSEIEGQIQLIKTVESFKGHLNTSLTGDIIYVNGKPQEEKGNADNEKLFDNFLRALLYEQKYPLSDYDTALNVSPKNAIKKAINKLAGKEVYTIDENPSALSLVKSMDALNRGFQLKTLGFEFISGAVNLFGANIQLATQAGNYFKGREIAANEGKLIGNRFKNDDEREMFVQLIDIFMPLKDDPSYEKMKASGMSVLTRQNFSDMLMYFMREPEHHVEKSVFLTLLDNSMIVDGRIVNIREYVKNKYKARYASAQDYRSQSKAIDDEIEELKKTKSITNTKELVDGKIVIPGLNLENFKEIERLKNLTRYISRQATGGMSDSDLNRAGMNIWTKSMMVFKGWIPKLVDTRFGEFRKVGDDFSVIIDDDGLTTGEKYDIGRVRLFASFLSFNIFKTIGNINDIIQVNENGVLQLDAMYEKFSEDYKKRTGEELTMSKEDFMDLIRTNLRNQVKELSILVAMVGLMLSVGFMAPDDDEDKATKNFFRYSQKVIDKFVGELSFFYNPVEFQKMLSGSTFPALGLFSDIERFISHFFMETTGLDLSDTDLTLEQVREKAQPVKYAAKMLPITKSLITYTALFSDEFAKEFDITVQKDNKR